MKKTGSDPQGIASTHVRGTSQKAKPSQRKKRRWPLALPVAGLVATGAWFFAGAQSGQTMAGYMSQPVERGDLVARVATTAVLRPRTQIQISSELKGTVQSVPVMQNQRVKRGDILIQLDSTIFEYELERSAALVEAAEAGLSDALIALEETDQKLTRAKALRHRNALSEQKLEDVQAERNRAANRVETAKADLAVKQVDLKLRRFDLSRSRIRSPIDGIVLARKAEPGRTVYASSEDSVLFILAEDLERMELIAKVNEADIGSIAEGQEATFLVDAYPDRTFRATIRDVSFAHRRENNLVTYEANLDVRNDDLKLRPGMTASVSITTDETTNALLIPTSALRYRPQTVEPESSEETNAEDAPGKALVHVLGDDGEPQPVRVELGVRNWEKAEVLSGLTEGQRVITGDALHTQ